MRWFSILLAALIAGVVYYLVMERDVLLQFARVDADTEDVAEMADADDPAASMDDNAEGRISIVAMASSAQVIDSAVLVRGRTEAAREVEVKAETSGQIVSEPLRKGSTVTAGQMLCQIDPGTRQAQLSQARAQMASAEAGLPLAQARVTESEALLKEAQILDTAATKLIEGGFASETRVVSAKAAVSSAEAGIESALSGLEAAHANIEAATASVALAEKEIDRLTIVAPFDGLLETDTAEIGSLMQMGSPCATIIQLDPIKLVGFISETQVNKVAVGSPAQARLINGTDVQGAVTFLSRSADPLTRTFRVEIEVSNADQRIRDGQTADIGIASAGETAHLIPASALTLDDSGTLGLRIVDSDPAKGIVADFAPVDFLRDTKDGVWVTGLPTNVDVIIVGQEYVTDGVPITVTYDQEISQ